MLTPADVQRYARQILLPRVGPGGQERWLGSRVEVAGGGKALEAAIEFLEAAGVAIDRRDAPPPLPLQGEGRVRGQSATAVLDNLVLGETAFADRRAACDPCLRAFFEAQPDAAPDEGMAVAFAAGAAAAAEILLGLLPDASRPPIAMAFVPEPRRVDVRREGCSCRS